MQESLRTSLKSSLLNPVRFGHFAHDPAPATSVSSCLSNGDASSSNKIFDSIHAANSRTGMSTLRVAFTRPHAAEGCRECFLLLRCRELGNQQSIVVILSFRNASATGGVRSVSLTLLYT